MRLLIVTSAIVENAYFSSTYSFSRGKLYDRFEQHKR